MEFITTNSKLLIEGDVIRIQIVSNTEKRNYLLNAFFFLWVVDTFSKRLDTAQATGTTSKWILTGFWGIILLLYTGIILDFIFRRNWKKTIPVSRIRKIKMSDSESGLESTAVLTLTSGRYQPFTFRVLEKQAAGFVQMLSMANHLIIVERS